MAAKKTSAKGTRPTEPVAKGTGNKNTDEIPLNKTTKRATAAAQRKNSK